MDTRRSTRFIASMWKYALAAAGGFLVTMLTLAVGREVYFAFQSRPAPDVIGDVLTTIGTLGWVDTTLVTGLAAVAAAAFSVREVRRQIELSDKAVQKQIDHATRIEDDRKESRHAANRAVLPLTLAAISEYAETSARLTRNLLHQCRDGVLPRSVPRPDFPDLPLSALDALKELIECLKPKDRRYFTKILVAVQVESSNQRALRNQRHIFVNNLEVHLLRQAEIYARASALFDFGRGEHEDVPDTLVRSEIRSALGLIGLWGSVRDDLTARYQLNTDLSWERD